MNITLRLRGTEFAKVSFHRINDSRQIPEKFRQDFWSCVNAFETLDALHCTIKLLDYSMKEPSEAPTLEGIIFRNQREEFSWEKARRLAFTRAIRRLSRPSRVSMWAAYNYVLPVGREPSPNKIARIDQEK